MGKKSKKRISPKTGKPRPLVNKPNPFEIRFNKQRHTILGRQSKKDRGMPGISRAKAMSKREKSLLKEYKDINKANSFVDRRIGENDATADPEERALARFAKEWRKNKKNTMFNLNDEDLTHLGKSLSEYDNFDDRKSSSEDENENLSGDFIKKAHFGGFMTLKSANKVEPEKSHKELMQELIQETKKQKYERQTEREANDTLTEKLDEEWKVLQSLVAKSKQPAVPEAKNTDNSYDIEVKSLKFEIKGKPTDRLKTEDEIAREAQEKLSRLEAERQMRMRPTVEKSESKVPHVSADSLDDGFALDDPRESDDDIKEEEEIENDDQEDNDIQKDGSEDNEDESDDNEDGSDDDKDDSNDTDDENENIYTGMLSDESDSENESELDDKDNEVPSNKETKQKHLPEEIPSNLEDLCVFFGDKSTSQRIETLENLIKNSRASLGGNYNKKMITLFNVLMEYVCVSCTKEKYNFLMVYDLVPVMFKLVHVCPSEMSRSLLDLLDEKRQKFLKLCIKNDGSKIPGLDTLILFKIVCMFYPTSDFHHAVVTASELFMSEILVLSRINSLQDIVKGLFICNLFLEYVSYAKRFVPEAVPFLQSLLVKGKRKILSGTLSTSKADEIVNHIPLQWLVNGSDVPSNSSTALQLLSCCIYLLKEFAKLYLELPSFEEIFQGLKPKLKAVISQDVFSSLKEVATDLQNILEKKPNRKPLVQGQKKVKCLKLFEPRLQPDFTGKKQRPVMSAKKAERQKLVYKYKKELKGAVREIRRDNQYISRVQLNEQMERDSERKEKLKSLYQDLAQQEGEFKRYKKRK